MLGIREDPKVRIKHRVKFFLQAVVFGTLQHLLDDSVAGDLLETFITKKAIQKFRPKDFPKRGLPFRTPQEEEAEAVAELVIQQPEKTELTEYRIEKHVTPKTNAAKAHWKGLPAEKKTNFSRQPARLEKLPGYKSHLDFRMKLPGDKRWISFAIPKGRIPSAGNKVQLVQSTAKHGYHSANPPIISDGYGAGVTKPVSTGHCLVTRGSKGTIHVWFEGYNYPFVMVPTDKKWKQVLLIGKGTEHSAHYERPFKMEDLSGQDISHITNNPKYIVERKYDGSHYRLIMTKDRKWLISRKPMVRNGKEVKLDLRTKTDPAFHGGSGLHGIDRGDNLVHLLDTIPNDQIVGKGKTELAVEIYAKGHGGREWETPHAYMTSVMNSHPVKAEMLQRKHGRLRVKVLDIVTLNGENVTSVPYGKKRQIMTKLHKNMGILRVPKGSLRNKEAFVEKERRKGGEGVVFKDVTSADPTVYKYKFKGTWDLRIKGVQIVEPTSSDSKWIDEQGNVHGAGVFILENDQPVKIPTDAMKIDAWSHPENYIGKYAEVSGMSMSIKTGKVRAPVLERIRFDK